MVATSFLYLKNHKLLKATSAGPIPIYVQRVVNLRYVQWIEHDDVQKSIKVKMLGSCEPEEYVCDEREDPTITKKIFYDVLKDMRAHGKVLEW